MSQAVAASNANHELLTLDEIGDALRAKFPPASCWKDRSQPLADLRVDWDHMELLDLCAQIKDPA